MKKYYFYHEITGEFSETVLTATDVNHVKANIPVGYRVYGGDVDIDRQKMDITANKLVGYVRAAKPPRRVRMHDAVIRIRHLEQLRQPRIVREVLLGYDGALARLRELDDEIAKLRKEMG